LDQWCDGVTRTLNDLARSFEDGGIQRTLKRIAQSARCQGSWDGYLWNTCRPTMNLHRCGVFVSPRGFFINLNRDIDIQFYVAVTRPLRDAFRPNFCDIDDIQLASASRRNLLEWQGLLNSLRWIENNYFDSYEAEIREYKRAQGIYRWKRKTMTTLQETESVLRNLLVPRVREGIQLLLRLVRDFSAHLHAPRRRFSEEDVAVLRRFFAFVGPFADQVDDEDSVDDPITSEPLTEPVQFFCRCTTPRIVNRSTLVRLPQSRCFYCRDPIDQTAVIPRHDILGMVHLRQTAMQQTNEDNLHMEPQAWVVQIWPKLMALLQETINQSNVTTAAPTPVTSDAAACACATSK
jgi:hypothetical protein